MNMRLSRGRSLAVLLIVGCFGWCGAAGPKPISGGGEKPSEGTKPQPAARPGKAKAKPYIVTTKAAYFAKLRTTGGRLINIMYSDRVQALADVKENALVDKTVLFQCNGPQRQNIRDFLPYVHEVIIMAYHLRCSVGPDADTGIWPTCGHPLVNRLRELRRSTAGKVLLPLLTTRGSPQASIAGMSLKRVLAIEELEWTIFAVIGADCEGLLWDGGRQGLVGASRFSRIDAGLKEYAGHLGAAQPVRWVVAGKGQPVSALSDGKKLFVVLLNPDYMATKPDYMATRPGSSVISLPVDPKERRADIVITPPADCTVKSGRSLLGRAAAVAPRGSSFLVEHPFSGGGDLLIFDLSWKPSTPVQKSTQAGKNRKMVTHE